ncbi:hypothetical protein B0A48_10671 [Cryoendolithus antarcticus]|uniref:21.2 kDa protein n=1 Tax=Cryoendolithus antarcticus TaxID=1507870 RepID=A0A1V8SYH5_9PEZI|nr:hypothetical protein B0A48_10671 [Cryoendolithus antarcticus]
MSDPSLYTYESPLVGWEGGKPLSDEPIKEGPDAKSLPNPSPTRPSEAYHTFTSPISNDTRGGFDIHIYYVSSVLSELQFARELHTRIRREFPELRIYRMFDEPVGPHPVGMFEVNVFDPKQFGAFVGWLVVNRGPLSALVHPNTGVDLRDHTQLATWMGQPYPLQLGALRAVLHKRRASQIAMAGNY